MEQTGVNIKYEIEVEIISPLHIGCGDEWIRDFDFEIENNTIYSTDYLKQRLNEYELPSAMKNGKDVRNGQLYKISKIKPFVKNQFTKRAVLTGSSIKGAIRSILFQYLGGKTEKGEDVFGKSETGDEFMRFFKFSDVEFKNTELVNTKIYNLQGYNGNYFGGWKSFQNTSNTFSDDGFNTVYECLTPDTPSVVKASLSISNKLFYNFLSKHGIDNSEWKKRFLDEIPDVNDRGIRLLFQTINEHTQSYLQKEYNFFDEYNGRVDFGQNILSRISQLQQIKLKPNECLFKMSAGSGFHSITGDWQFDDYSISYVNEIRRGNRVTHTSKGKNKVGRDVKSAKSRKIAIWNRDLYLPGFIKLRFTPSSVLEEQTKSEKLAANFMEKISTASDGDFAPTNLKVGDIVDAYCHKKKSVRIENANYDIQLVVQKDIDADQLIGKVFKVQIAQISKAGKIVQVTKN